MVLRGAFVPVQMRQSALPRVCRIHPWLRVQKATADEFTEFFSQTCPSVSNLCLLCDDALLSISVMINTARTPKAADTRIERQRRIGPMLI